jgi:DNA gyrase subunit A
LKSDGIIAINLADDDELISVRHASESAEVVLVTKNGMGIRFPQSEARPMGRATAGVKGITLKGSNDVVLSMDVVPEGAAADLFLITEKGFGKRTALAQFRSQGRGGQGVIAMKTDGERGLSRGRQGGQARPARARHSLELRDHDPHRRRLCIPPGSRRPGREGDEPQSR